MRAAVLDDVRIQYFRQTRNIGATANFEFVLEKSNGKYFFWMADDDLCDKYFVEKIVSALEQDSNLVLCGCDVTVIDESDQFLESIKLDSIRPNGNWLLTRKLFFCYPTSNIFFCIYGIARTEILKKCGGLYKFAWKGLATNSEVTFLARLSRAGKIAAIPEYLKLYRRHPNSVYHREINTISKFDAFMLRLTIRISLCWLALSAQGSIAKRLPLLNAVLMSSIQSIRLPESVLRIIPKSLRESIKFHASKLLHLWR